MRSLRKLKGPEIRLLLSAALCVLLFVASSTVHRDEDVCAAADTGHIGFYNNSKEDVIFNYSGMGELGMGQRVNAHSSLILALESGVYSYSVLAEIFNEKTNVTILKLRKSGSFKILPQRTVSVIYK